MTTTVLAPPLRAKTPVQAPTARNVARRRPGLAQRSAQHPLARTARILIVDDDAMARSWLRLSLRETEFRIAMEAATAGEALALLTRLRFDVVLVDHRLPDSSGTELSRELRRRGIEAAVVLTSTGSETGFNEAAREAGAQGTLVKTGSPSELLETLRTAVEGAPTFDPRHPARQLSSAALTAREREVLTLVAEGATNSEVAATLGVGIETVKTLLRRIFLKLGVHRRVQAVWAARELGLV